MQKINITDEIKIALALSAKEGFQCLADNKETYDLTTQNGAGAYRSNFVNVCIRKNLEDVFQIVYPKRGNWEVCLLYNCETKISISILSGQTYKELKRIQNKNAHYLEALNSINDSSENIIEHQLDFNSSFHDRNPEEILKIKNKMYFDIAGEVQTHVMVIYNSKTLYEISGLRAIVATSKFDTICEEDWSQFLDKDLLLSTFSNNKTEKTQTETNVTIFDETIEDAPVKLKSKRKKKNK